MKTAAITLLVCLSACCGGQKAASGTADEAERTRPLMVYRTVQDVHDKVPVGLSADRQHITSYPQPKDLLADGKMRLPTKLVKGYWLDNKGVGLNTGFLSMTYAEYAALPQAPPIAEMEAMLLDRDPLASLCDCGTQGTMDDPVTEINALLKKDALRERCKVLK